MGQKNDLDRVWRAEGDGCVHWKVYSGEIQNRGRFSGASLGSSPERPVNGWPVDHAATFLRRLFLVSWVLAGGGSSPSSLRNKASWWRSRSLTDTRHQRSAARIMVA